MVDYRQLSWIHQITSGDATIILLPISPWENLRNNCCPQSASSEQIYENTCFEFHLLYHLQGCSWFKLPHNFKQMDFIPMNRNFYSRNTIRLQIKPMVKLYWISIKTRPRIYVQSLMFLTMKLPYIHQWTVKNVFGCCYDTEETTWKQTFIFRTKKFRTTSQEGSCETWHWQWLEHWQLWQTVRTHPFTKRALWR